MHSVLSFTSLSLLTILDTTVGDSVSLTPLNPSSSIASISLVEDGDYHTITDDNKYQCNAGNYDSFCVYLDIYNTGCSGTETVSVTVNGENIGHGTSNVDLFALFSVKNTNDNSIDYFSFFSDWSGLVAATIGGQSGGVFITPDCGNNLLLQTNNIDTLLDESKNPWNMRQYIAGDTTDDWDLLTSDKIGADATSVSYTVINDPFNNQITASFDASTNDFNQVSCVFDNQVFDRSIGGNDYLIAFGIDQDIIEFSQFDVTVTCDNPTEIPTQSPTKQPTSICENDFNSYDTSALYRWYSSKLYNHLYTINTSPLAPKLGYIEQGIEGYLWDNEIVGVTVPLFRYFYAGNDHYYTTNYNEIGSGNEFYTLEGIAGYIMTESCDEVNQPLHQYYGASLINHFYTTDYDELGSGNDIYVYEEIVGYVSIN